mmetsp:Transcript_22484/g.42424  ORF Transcript_22484/g.42424 Transcript_22484/m.42424 type:complete len:180 (-) Transcript_22484:53-592(-)
MPGSSLGPWTHAADAMGPQAIMLDACRRGDYEAVEAALSQGARPNLSGKEARSPLHLAAELTAADPASAVKIAGKLIRAGASVDARDVRSNTPLHHCALYRGGIWLARLLLAYDADVMLRNADGERPSDLLAKHWPGDQQEDFYVLLKSRESQITEEMGQGDLSPLGAIERPRSGRCLA